MQQTTEHNSNADDRRGLKDRNEVTFNKCHLTNDYKNLKWKCLQGDTQLIRLPSSKCHYEVKLHSQTIYDQAQTNSINKLEANNTSLNQ